MANEFDLTPGTEYFCYTKWGYKAKVEIIGNECGRVQWTLTDNEGLNSGLLRDSEVGEFQYNLGQLMKRPSSAEPTLSGQRTFTAYNDPGHGWVKVKQDDLLALGIADDITSYSYRKGQWAYLEEDCDYTTWVEAFRKVTGQEPKIKDRYSNGMSTIRNYSGYVSPTGNPWVRD